MNKRDKRRLLTAFAVTGSIAAISTAIVFAVSANRKVTVSNKKTVEDRLIELNQKANYAFENSSRKDELLTLDYLLNFEKEVHGLLNQSNELENKIAEEESKSEDLANLEYKENKKVSLPTKLNEEYLTPALANILENAKIVGNKIASEVNDVDANLVNEAKQKINESTNVEEVMNAIKLIKSINDFKNELKDSIYYSNKSKDFIKSEFDKLTDKERIENFIESYQYTSLIKKDFYDNYLTDEQEIDKVIETLNKQDFLDAVNIEKITELINNISEVNELKKEVIEEYLPKYVRNVLRKKVNYNTEISKSRSEFKARRVIARNLQNILFSTNKDEIEKFKKMLMNALEANKKDDFTKFAGFLSAYAIEENTTKFQRAIQEIIHPIYVNSMWYFDKEYPETTYESDFDLNENDISNIENGVTHNGNGRYYEYDYYTLKEYNNKKNISFIFKP